jgi:hypothetical protein
MLVLHRGIEIPLQLVPGDEIDLTGEETLHLRFERAEAAGSRTSRRVLHCLYQVEEVGPDGRPTAVQVRVLRDQRQQQLVPPGDVDRPPEITPPCLDGARLALRRDAGELYQVTPLQIIDGAPAEEVEAQAAAFSWDPLAPTFLPPRRVTRGEDWEVLWPRGLAPFGTEGRGGALRARVERLIRQEGTLRAEITYEIEALACSLTHGSFTFDLRAASPGEGRVVVDRMTGVVLFRQELVPLEGTARDRDTGASYLASGTLERVWQARLQAP